MKNILFILLFISGYSKAQTPTIKWWFDVDDSSFGQSAMDDLNGDGKKDVVFGCYRNDSMVYALNGANGALLWKYNTSGSAEGCNDVAMLICDIDTDGKKEVIVPSSCNPKTFCFNGLNGTVRWTANTSGSDSPPVLADLNKDQIPEIIHGEFGGSVRSLNGLNGTLNWQFSVDSDSWIQTAPTLVDLDGNGQTDFVVATWHFSNNNKVYAYNGANHSLMWSYPLSDVVYHGTAVADLDKNGRPELILGDYSGTLTALHHDGTLFWNYNAGAYIGSPVSVADIDGDGFCELVFCASNKVIALNHDGSLLWNYTLPGYSTSFRGAALCDMNGDTKPDVVFGTSKGVLMALNGMNGNQLWSLDLAAHYGDTLDFDHAPVIGDMDLDGYLDIFIVGGYTQYPNFSVNYGRAYAVSTSQIATAGNNWPMFQYNIQRNCSKCGVAPVGIQEVKMDYVPLIYPNPAHTAETIHIHMDPLEELMEIHISDLTGRILYSSRVISHEMDFKVPFIPSGMYFLTLQTNRAKRVQSLLIEE
ncbi:MAG TPA: FG-GAP-like repeat-containing protein [Chitinophagaceae bacterium]|nr:FG-GAP-like repeat-containing protein [Chitinophagaceae bacterium]HNF71317.1 FG-GAP-like repeat-containing protein [Chitinophagaceae bacterium]